MLAVAAVLSNRAQTSIVVCCASAFVVVFVAAWHLVLPSFESTFTPASDRPDGCPAPEGPHGWVPPPVIYGHIHMAKTGGTTLNGALACRFERVCGHKGNTYDFAQVNARRSANMKGYNDTYVLIERGFNRGRVPPKFMDEVGYEDCDYISHEIEWTWWRRFDTWHLPVEIHVPCRDPVDHLMSQCNLVHIRFDCSRPIEPQVRRCKLYWDRYGDGLQSKFDVKCYRFELQFTEYMQYMSQRLQARRKQVNYSFVSTNRPRSRARECIFAPEHADLKRRLEGHLLNGSEYYRFCAQCIGSKNDLLH